MRRPGNKKAAALLLLAAILAALLTGCGKDVSFEATSARAIKALAVCESVHAEMSMTSRPRRPSSVRSWGWT